MDSTVIILIVVIVALALALAAAGVMLLQRRRTARLQEHYGPEYDRSLGRAGTRRAGEAELTEREKRHRELDIRDLRSDERDRFATSWAEIQREFVDDPKRAVRNADMLVVEIMRTRGYPVDDFERRAEDISVEHPEVVQRYREAHAVRDATENGGPENGADTERQRSAVTSYRSLIDALLGSRGAGQPSAGQDRAGHARDSHDQRGDQRADDRRDDGQNRDQHPTGKERTR